MNFAKTKDSIVTTSFDFTYNDKTGTPKTEKITFSFYERCLTPAFFDAVSRFRETQNSSDIAKHLSPNITEWDLHWNKEPFPPSYENLSTVCDVDFLMDLINAMSSVIGGDKKKPTQSQNGSAVAESKSATATEG